MKYREKLLELILDDNDNPLEEWLVTQPILEQPDILRELKQISQEAVAENGDDLNEIIEGYDTFDEQIENYEDKILDEKLAEAEFVMAQQDLDKKMLEIDEITAGVRRFVIDCIINNQDNAEAMKELALKLIASEKENKL